MATVEVSPTTYEPCDAFTGDEADSPVCAACGWLDAEHRTDPVPTANQS